VFEDRTTAGERLAETLEGEDIDPDVVLAVPRGGVPVGRAVADRLQVPLDVIVARKIGAPGNPERAIGAVAADGSCSRNDRLIERLDVPEAEVERRREEAIELARDRRQRYRETEAPPAVEDRAVLVVDDGIETGSTAIACLHELEAVGADRTLVGVPVGPVESLERLDSTVECDRAIAVERPVESAAVGYHYRSFKQVTVDEAIDLLERGPTLSS
jgi:predicted phosphoribosyltransferase